MPKHALAPTRETPKLDALDPSKRSSTTLSTSTSVALSNEVLLRSKIAQLQEQQRKPCSEASGLPPGSTGGKGSAKAKKSGSKRRSGGTANRREGSRKCGQHVARTRPENEEDIMRRFDEQVRLFCKSAPLQEGVATGEHWPGLTDEGMQVLRDMYGEQIRRARTAIKHSDVLTQKTQRLQASTEAMRAKTEECAREIFRLEQATSKLHALSIELEGRHRAMMNRSHAEAADKARIRGELSSMLNVVVGDVSAKIKEQERLRLAQDAENAKLRDELKNILEDYDEKKDSSAKAIEAQEKEAADLTKRLEELTAAAKTSLETESVLRRQVDEVNEREGVLRRRVGEHAARLTKQEAGLKTYLDSVQRLQMEENTLSATLARLSQENGSSRLEMGLQDFLEDQRTSEPKGLGATRPDNIEERLQALIEEKTQTAIELEAEKETLQSRCRELQAERKRVAAEFEALVAAGEGDVSKIDSMGTACPDACEQPSAHDDHS